MNKNICFIDLLQNKYGFYEATQTIETASIRSYLKTAGINTSIYLDDSIPSVNDMAEDILSLSDEILIFIWHKTSDRLICALMNHIQNLENIEVYIIGDAQPGLGENAIIINDNLEEKLAEYLEFDIKKESANILSASPYSDKTLLVRQAEKSGVWLGDADHKRSIEYIKNDITAINSAYSGLIDNDTVSIPFKGYFIDDADMLDAIVKYCEEINSKFLRYEIHISDKLLPKVSDTAKMITYSIELNSNLDKKRKDAILSHVSNNIISKIYFPASWLENDKNLIALISGAAKSKFSGFYPVGEINSTKVKPEILSSVLYHTRERYLPFIRGFVKSFTGFYSGQKLDGYVHHVEIPEELYKANGNSFLNELVGVNSSLYIKNSKPEIADGKLCFDEDGIAILDDRNYTESLKIVTAENCHVSNMIAIDSGDIHINSLGYVSKDKIVDISYSQAKVNLSEMKKKFAAGDKTIYALRMKDKSDFNEFLSDAKHYKDTHTVVNTPLPYGYLENVCRFINPSGCAVDKVPRIKLDTAGNIHTCDLQTDSVAKKDISLFEMNHSCFTKRENELNNKGCYSCAVRAWCPRCSELPPFMKDEYCEIMKKQTYVLDFAFFSFLFLRLVDTYDSCKGVLPDEITISNEHMYNIISDDIKSAESPYLPKFTNMFLIRGKYFLWSPATNKFYNISREFACVIELLLKRVDSKSIGELLSQTLNITSAESDEILPVILSTLKKSGILYRDIYKSSEAANEH